MTGGPTQALRSFGCGSDSQSSEAAFACRPREVWLSLLLLLLLLLLLFFGGTCFFFFCFFFFFLDFACVCVFLFEGDVFLFRWVPCRRLANTWTSKRGTQQIRCSAFV